MLADRSCFLRVHLFCFVVCFRLTSKTLNAAGTSLYHSYPQKEETVLRVRAPQTTTLT